MFLVRSFPFSYILFSTNHSSNSSTPTSQTPSHSAFQQLLFTNNFPRYLCNMKPTFLEIIDIIGIVAFSISGVYAAMEKRLDIFGVLIIAFITSFGGGTLRDLLLGNTPLFWLTDKLYGWIVLGSALTAILFRSILKNFRRTLLVFDSLGLGLFTIVGIQIAQKSGLSPIACIALGTITGCFGGIFRDIVLNKIPIIFEKEIYASACLIGGVVYILLLQTTLIKEIADVIAICTITIIRLLAVRFDFRLPSIYKE